VQAEKVDPEKAGRIAQRYIDQNHKLQTKTDVRLKYTATSRQEQQGKIQRTTTPNGQETVYYYVFEAGNGFVIVAGDDAVRPILGYSPNGNYDENNLNHPPNFACWMNNIQQEIADAQKQSLSQSEDIRQEWDRYLSGMVRMDAPNIVGPLLTTKWKQDAPYNNLCPEFPDNPEYSGDRYRCITGCVATAMAQIMKFHEYPEKGSGKSDAYTTTTLKLDIPSVDFNVNYDWKNMLDSYSGSESLQQRQAVATLMYHCGASVKMDYTIDESGASTVNVLSALVNFGYDKSIEKKTKNEDGKIWDNLIREQIDMGMPVFYSGSYLCSGHAFVCDGYDNTGLFHFNWGWGGDKDGYYVTSSLNPGPLYNDRNQEIIINIRPGGKYNPFDGGSGTNNDPYLISNPSHLYNLFNLLKECNTIYSDKYYKLTDDLDLSRYSDNSTGWAPIGNIDCPFKGVFDGNNKKITGLYINSKFDYIGLFGCIDQSAEIKNLGIENAIIEGKDFVGGIVGKMENRSIIKGCYVTGYINGSNARTGGIAGGVYNSELSDCYSAGTVKGNSSVGGIAGVVDEQSAINKCYSASTVKGLDRIGGITGSNLGGSQVNNCVALNPIVNGNSNIGRVTGENNGALSGNFAFCNMNPDGGLNFQGVNAHNGLGGDGKSHTDLKKATGFPLGFTDLPWKYTEGKLPGLFGEAVEMPMHLQRSINTDIDLNGNKTVTVYPINFLDDETVCNYKYMFTVNGKESASLTFSCDSLDQTIDVSIITINASGIPSQPKVIPIRIIDSSPPVFDVISRVIALDDNNIARVSVGEFVNSIKDNCYKMEDFEFFFCENNATSMTFTSCTAIGTHKFSICARNKRNNTTSLPHEITCTIRAQMAPEFDLIFDRNISLDKNGAITIYPREFIVGDSICAEGNKDKAVYKFIIDDALEDSRTFLCHETDDYIFPIYVKIGDCGNPRIKYIPFTISDAIPPEARCKPAIINLDSDGNVSLKAIALNNGSRDNCTIDSMQIKKTSDGDDMFSDSLHFTRDDFLNPTENSIPITFRVIDASGWKDECQTYIRLRPSDLGDIPNIFTPNGDGFNDTWIIQGLIQYPQASIRIYNRDRKLMIELKGEQMAETGWNGRDRYGNLLESGYYLYQIEVVKGGKIINGFVTILY